MYKVSKYNIYLKDKIYNLISKKYITVSEQLILYLQKNDVLCSDFPKDIEKMLLKNSIVVDYDENQLMDFNYNSLKFDYRKASFILYPTLKCNFSCHYCFESVKNGTIDQLCVDTLKVFFKEKSRIYEDINLRISGGEPLIVWNKLKDILSVFENYKGNLSIGIATNGYYLTENVAMEMKKNNISSVQITVDGTEKSHNEIRYTANDKKTYDKVIQGVVNASKHIKTRVRLNVDELNKHTFSDFLSELEKQPLNKNNIEIFVKPIRLNQGCSVNTDLVDDVDFFDIELNYYKIAKQKGFYYAMHPNFNSDIRCIYHQINSFAIDPKLNLYKCAALIGLEKSKIGHINDKSQIEITNVYKHRELLMYNPNVLEECRSCQVLPICNGKCPVEWEKNQRKEHFGCIPEKKSIMLKVEQLINNEL